MLKIENYDKLIRRDVGMWRIGRIEEIETAYLIQLMKPNGFRMQVNLERKEVNGEYELWCWDSFNLNGSVSQTALPKRTFLKFDWIKDQSTLLGAIYNLTIGM